VGALLKSGFPEARGTRATLCIPALVAVAAYLPALSGTFVWDDTVLLYNQPYLRDPSLWSKALAHFLSVISSNYFRPVAVFTFLADARVWGLHPAGFHLTNVLLHALNTLLVTLLARELVTRRVDQHRQAMVAVVTGLVYGLHPALVESVAFTSSRFDVLMTTWVLLALFVDTRFRNSNAWRLGAVGVLFLAAALTKETGVVLPLVLLLWRIAIDSAATWKRRETLAAMATCAIAGLVYLALRFCALGFLYRSNAPSAIPAGDALQRVLLVTRSMLEYTLVIIFPFATRSPLHVASLPIPPHDLTAWASVLLVALLASGGFAAFRRVPQFVALCGAGLVALLPALNVLPLELSGGMFAADRYLTLPLALFALALAALVARHPARMRMVHVAAAIWLVACCATIELTLPHWRDDVALWTWAAERAPSSALPHVNLSNYYIDHGDNARVLAEADAAIQRDPTSAKAWNNRGVALLNTDQFAAAQSAWERATQLDASNALSWSNLANALGAQGRFDEAERMLIDRALRLNPDLAMAQFSLGEVYLSMDRPDLAIARFERALQLLPPNRQAAARESLAHTREPERWLRLGNLLLHRDDAQGAEHAYAQASTLGASPADIAVSRSSTLIELQAPAEAERILMTALAQSPGDARLYNNLGVVARARHNPAAAREWFSRAIALAPIWDLPAQNLRALDSGE
jgi:tetratricopeptide (TPR) repeat protein